MLSNRLSSLIFAKPDFFFVAKWKTQQQQKFNKINNNKNMSLTINGDIEEKK